ncbi:class I SAM-dependent methyltransferase [Bosea sp. BK604]|uniref:class I SAM-dependent methyltransferase n=1 Tax=Bosea sp. BK604 TaxID=2512180 RepID=UPI001050C169|nr:class I SAM-dependent methyltransferase [Bosea sp. BK604]TCR70009.1 methyltransferase family protein [Bosea sp. BK604]
MAEWTSGIYRLVGMPKFYAAFQDALGAAKGRKRLVREFIRPEPGSRILDLGCGSAAILPDLPSDVRYVGIDHNPRHIAKAKASHGEAGLFHAGDFSAAASLSAEPYDLVLALGLLHHLEDDEVRSLLKLVRSVIGPNGRFLTVDPVFIENQPAIARFLIRNDSGRNVRDEMGYAMLSRSIFPQVETFIHHDYLRFPYTHCFMEHRLG